MVRVSNGWGVVLYIPNCIGAANKLRYIHTYLIYIYIYILASGLPLCRIVSGLPLCRTVSGLPLS